MLQVCRPPALRGSWEHKTVRMKPTLRREQVIFNPRRMCGFLKISGGEKSLPLLLFCERNCFTFPITQQLRKLGQQRRLPQQIQFIAKSIIQENKDLKPNPDKKTAGTRSGCL